VWCVIRVCSSWGGQAGLAEPPNITNVQVLLTFVTQRTAMLRLRISLLWLDGSQACLQAYQGLAAGDGHDSRNSSAGQQHALQPT
jgi:hypothetical protein